MNAAVRWDVDWAVRQAVYEAGAAQTDVGTQPPHPNLKKFIDLIYYSKN